MTPALLGTLAVLALIDSTSFGTLVIPIWLMLAPGRVRPMRIVVFLGTVAVFYLGVGLLLLGGATWLQAALGGADPATLLELPGVRVGELVLGLTLVVGSFWIDSPKRRAAASSKGPGRLARWREQAMGDGPRGGLVLLALAAALIEVGSMLPYLAGIGLVSASGIDWPASGLVIAGYCAVMIAPALVLLVVRTLAARAVEPVLRRLSDWLSTHAASTTAWIVGILGFLLARDAAIGLGLFG